MRKVRFRHSIASSRCHQDAWVPERRTHSYVRHGTTPLFGALDVASGLVIGKCYKRHRAVEFLKCVKEIEAQMPEGLDVHIVMDNYATHKTPQDQRLAPPSAPLSCPLHADIRVMDQSGRALVRHREACKRGGPTTKGIPTVGVAWITPVNGALTSTLLTMRRAATDPLRGLPTSWLRCPLPNCETVARKPSSGCTIWAAAIQQIIGSSARTLIDERGLRAQRDPVGVRLLLTICTRDWDTYKKL